MKRFYTDNISSGLALLSEEESHHCLQVLRLDHGDQVEVINGEGYLWQATVERLSKKTAALRLGDILASEEINPYFSHLAVAMTKNMDRMEWLLEKATELGLASFHPIITERTERSKLRTERLEKIAIAATKQSLRLWKPVVHEPIPFHSFLDIPAPDDTKLVAHCMKNSGKKSLINTVKPGMQTWILIGPEGDFTDDEITAAIQLGYQPVTLGKARLRVETAALAACTYIHLINQEY